jgi:hypothetical protein
LVITTDLILKTLFRLKRYRVFCLKKYPASNGNGILQVFLKQVKPFVLPLPQLF